MLLRELESKRLRLRNYEEKDVDDLFEFSSDDNYTKHLKWYSHKDKKQTLEWVLFCKEQNSLDLPATLFWIIELKSEKKVIGTIDLIINWKNKISELAYGINPRYWSKEYAVEAAQLLIDYSFDTLKLHRVQAHCRTTNKKSERVLQKLGMRHEGIEYASAYEKGKIYNLHLYSLINPEIKIEDREE